MNRVYSIDVYRGFVMFLMMAEVLSLSQVAEQLPQSGFRQFLSWHQSHVPWVGCSLHDLIQPSFTFLVGVALPYSIASRVAKGQSFRDMAIHAFKRALILIFLGIFLRSMHRSQTYFTFEDTLTQIGLGYFFLFLLGFAKPRTQLITLTVLLAAYWLAFVLYPLPGPDFDYTAVGVPADWPHHASGLAAHWNKNSNLAWAFDTWWLNLFPREAPFTHNGGGYATLSFIPTLGTMILGLQAGRLWKSDRQLPGKLKIAAITGISLLAAGWLLNLLGICPNVKRIWTPSWTLFSGGWCFLILALFGGIVDYFQAKKWFFPLMVIGANSIAAYVIAETLPGFLRSTLNIHLGSGYNQLFGAPYAPLVTGAAVLLLEWLLLFWMYRRKIFIKI